MPIISICVAMDQNRVIGYQNEVPWHLPADLERVKQLTMGKPIVMGRKTFASIGRPLPGRRNVILSRHVTIPSPGCEVYSSLPKALIELENEPEIIIFGGAEIFQEALPIAHRIYLTEIEHSFHGDTFFPEWPSEDWMETKNEYHDPDPKNVYPYRFILLERAMPD